MNRQRQQSRHRHVLTVTACDRWMSNSIIRGLLCYKRKSEFTLRALTRHADNHHVRELEKLGAEIVEIDYNKPKSIEDALCDTNWLVVFNEDSHNTLREAEELAKAAHNCDIENMIFMSIEGADKKETKTQKEFYEMEKMFCEYNKSLVIFRSAFPQEVFMLWSEASQDDAVWLWPIGKRHRFCPVSLSDIVECTIHVICDEKGYLSPYNHHKRQKYRLTGPEHLGACDFVEIINDNIHEGELEVKEVDCDEFEDYLRNLDDEDDQRRYNYRDENRRRRRGRPGDRDIYPAPFLPLSNREIDCLMDYLEYVEKGLACRVSNDVRKLTHNEPQPVDNFFKHNSDEFQPDTRRRPGRPHLMRQNGRRDRNEMCDCKNCISSGHGHRRSYIIQSRF